MMARESRIQELREFMVQDGLGQIVETYLELHRQYPRLGMSPYEIIERIVDLESERRSDRRPGGSTLSRQS